MPIRSSVVRTNTSGSLSNERLGDRRKCGRSSSSGLRTRWRRYLVPMEDRGSASRPLSASPKLPQAFRSRARYPSRGIGYSLRASNRHIRWRWTDVASVQAISGMKVTPTANVERGSAKHRWWGGGGIHRVYPRRARPSREQFRVLLLSIATTGAKLVPSNSGGARSIPNAGRLSHAPRDRGRLRCPGIGVSECQSR